MGRFIHKFLAKLTILIGSLTILIGIWFNAYSHTSLAQTNFTFDAPHSSHNPVLIPAAQLPDVQIGLQPIASGFNLPVQVTNAGDGSNRLFIVEQNGRIKYIQNYQNTPKTTFLDITDRVGCCTEQTGLFSVAFPPDFATKRHFYVFYTNKVQTPSADYPISDKIIVSRFSLLPNDLGDPNSEQIIFSLNLMASGFEHKGGQLAFSPVDGYLYITVGDSGFRAEAQKTNSLYGKILRLDVETGNPVTYTIPASNPFTQTVGYRGEIWAIGVRNPWRGGFDPGGNNGEDKGDYYFGDVGLDTREEISYQAANTPGGVNFGWACREGTFTLSTTSPCNNPALLASMTDPIAEYDHNGQSAAVTGGFVYRGSLSPALTGRYFYADSVSGRIWSIYKTGPNSWSTPDLEMDSTLQPGSFGQDEQGEVYIVHLYSGNQIYRIIDASILAPNLTQSSKNASTDYANAGEAVTYTIVLSNTGGLTTTTAFLTDTVPAGLTYVPGSLSASQGVVNASGNPVLLWQGALSPTRQITITYKITVTASVGTFNNQAQVMVAGLNLLTLTNILNVPRLTNTTTITDFFLPGTQPGTLTDTIADIGICQNCHTTASIYTKWRGSMMSQAGRDPLMWSALHIANQDAPEVGDFCLRCHTPKGWLEGRSHPADGSALDPNLDIPVGVTCEVCHRLVDPVPGSTDTAATIDSVIRAAITPTIPYTSYLGSGMMILDPQDQRRGPFTVNAPHTPTYQTDFTGQTSANLTRSRLCGTCHNVDNPALSWDQNKNQYWPNTNNQSAPSFLRSDLFPIERTFEEWKNSAYASGVYAPQFAGAKADGIVGACQDCHMPRTTGKAADHENAVNRDCQTTGCLPDHEFFGGNVWVPQLLQDLRWRLKSDDVTELNNTVTNAQLFLQKSASMSVTLATSGTNKLATVRVTNQTGHKLPTGYPEGRRMWLNLKAYDANNQLIFEAGAYNASTGVLDQGSTKIYEAKFGVTQELADLLNRPGIISGESFHFVLNNVVLKDNRIPPRGFTPEALNERGLKPVGASYTSGQYWDDTSYTVPANTTRVVATLNYQTSSKEYIDFLRNNGGNDGATLGQMWDDSKSAPVQVAVAQFPANAQSKIYLPIVIKNN